MGKRDLVAEIAASIPTHHGPQPWWQRVEAEHQPTLQAIHAAWREGRLGRKRITAARSIAAKLRDEFKVDIREQGVIRWLNLPTY
jgi:hypothetical protein